MTPQQVVENKPVLSEEVKSIVADVLTSLTTSYPQWKCQANYDLKAHLGAFDIIVKDVATDRLYQLRITTHGAWAFMKMPHDKAVNDIFAFLTSRVQIAFDENRGLALPQMWDDNSGKVHH